MFIPLNIWILHVRVYVNVYIIYYVYVHGVIWWVLIDRLFIILICPYSTYLEGGSSS